MDLTFSARGVPFEWRVGRTPHYRSTDGSNIRLYAGVPGTQVWSAIQITTRGRREARVKGAAPDCVRALQKAEWKNCWTWRKPHRWLLFWVMALWDGRVTGR